ncbi:uncharacterized protein LOC143459641 [Clavelina lepadiformis]|uniref:Enoyl reductase (ER) domain-containing protein n=1 Tax=Clavelina lepadiformis TaxID=159417 RepID=A0ABP0GDC8_CLALP
MEALWWHGKVKELTFNEKQKLPEPYDPEDVKIKVAYSGICGSDFHYMKGEMGKFAAKDDGVILGHEFSGTVVGVGEKAAKRFKIGDRVCVDPNMCCKECSWWKKGCPHFCTTMKSVGVKADGGWAQYSVVAENKVHKLPDVVSLKQGALAEPYSCVLRGWKHIEPLPPKDCKILVQGGGIIGILFCTVLHHNGYSNVTISEPSEERRKLCSNSGFGFDVVHPQEILLKMAANDMDQHGFELIIDCTGNASAVEKAFDLACRGGKICVFGCCPAGKKISIEPFQIYWKELKIVGSFINPFCFVDTIPLLENLANKGYLSYEKLGIKEFPLADYKEAIDSLKSGNATKAVFKLNE